MKTDPRPTQEVEEPDRGGIDAGNSALALSEASIQRQSKASWRRCLARALGMQERQVERNGHMDEALEVTSRRGATRERRAQKDGSVLRAEERAHVTCTTCTCTCVRVREIGSTE